MCIRDSCSKMRLMLLKKCGCLPFKGKRLISFQNDNNRWRCHLLNKPCIIYQGYQGNYPHGWSKKSIKRLLWLTTSIEVGSGEHLCSGVWRTPRDHIRVPSSFLVHIQHQYRTGQWLNIFAASIVSPQRFGSCWSYKMMGQSSFDVAASAARTIIMITRWST